MSRSGPMLPTGGRPGLGPVGSQVRHGPRVDRQVPTCITFCGVGDVFKALSDPTRRTILDELTDRSGQTLFEICARLATKYGLGSSRQAISQHLDVLEA